MRCWKEWLNLAAAVLATFAGAVTMGVLLGAPDPTTLTKWAAVGAGLATLSGLAWALSAMIGLRDCLQAADAEDNAEAIGRLNSRIDELERIIREIREATGGD